MLRFVPTRSTAPSGQRVRVPPESGDDALVQRIARGDPGAFEEVYRREVPALHRYAYALCGNAAWAADATQDAFVALATRPHTFDAARGSLGAWLAGVARHALLAQWRRHACESPWPGPGDDGAEDAPHAQAASPETLLVREQRGEAVWAAVCRLPFAQREAIVLVDLQERSYEEAARVIGVEINTLRTRLHRGRARLAQWLEGRT